MPSLVFCLKNHQLTLATCRYFGYHTLCFYTALRLADFVAGTRRLINLPDYTMQRHSVAAELSSALAD
jgi:hypothetical protein